jgi:hypothetical protein
MDLFDPRVLGSKSGTLLDGEELHEDILADETIADLTTVGKYMPLWAYITIFFLPATVTTLVLLYAVELEILSSTIIGLAVMNGSINVTIAWLTIRLDGHSAEALDHLDTIIHSMGELEATLDNANDRVTEFTSDLDEAKELFRKVGVDLDGLDLEPVADVVEKLKENKDGLSEVLDNLRDIDVGEYISQAKRIEWKELLNAAEEIMGFISSKSGPSPMMKPPARPTPVSIPEMKTYITEDEEAFLNEEPDLVLAPPKKKVLDLTPPRR